MRPNSQLTHRHHRYDAAKLVHALASEPFKVTLACSEKTNVSFDALEAGDTVEGLFDFV